MFGGGECLIHRKTEQFTGSIMCTRKFPTGKPKPGTRPERKGAIIVRAVIDQNIPVI